MANVESSSATLENNNGRAVWVVTLTGDGKTVTVAVDAATGGVINLEVQ